MIRLRLPKQFPRPHLPGTIRLTKSHKTIAIMAGIGVFALAIGIGLGALIESPGEAARKAAPPSAGPITATVEMRTIANVVTMRGDVGYNDSTEVNVLTADLTGPAIVTAQPAKVGTTIAGGAAIAQVTGRPVIALEGGLPTYRTLRVGAKGPDVIQLKKALKALGLAPGNLESDSFDAACAQAVGQLYQRAGYTPPEATKEELEAVKSAASALTEAESALQQARDELAKTGHTVPDSQAINAANRAVADAQATYDAAIARGICPPGGEVDTCYPTITDRNLAITLARNALDQAKSDRESVLHPAKPDTAAQQHQVDAAGHSVDEARKALTEAQNATLPYVPSSEVVYLNSLPRRVDQVLVSYGEQVSGPIMKVSGEQLTVVATASADQAALLKPGASAQITMPNGTDELKVAISAITPSETDDGGSGTGGTGGGTGGGTSGGGAKSDDAQGTGDSGSGDGSSSGGSGGGSKSGGSGSSSSGEQKVTMALPKTLPAAQVQALVGQNVRVRIPVESTKGEVLAVPVAALDAGPSGETRVTRVNADGSTTLVSVTQGLAAQGYVEINPDKGTLKAGDRVVVGAA